MPMATRSTQRILVVDDDAEVRKAHARVVQALGYDVERYKIMAVMLSGLFAGLAGVLYAMTFKAVNFCPSSSNSTTAP